MCTLNAGRLEQPRIEKQFCTIELACCRSASGRHKIVGALKDVPWPEYPVLMVHAGSASTGNSYA